MSKLRAGALVFLSILYVLGATFTLMSLSLLTLLNPELYVKALDDSDAYTYLGELIENNEFITPEELQPISVRLVNNTVHYIAGDTDALDLKIDVSKNVEQYFILHTRDFRLCKEGENPFVGKQASCRPPTMSEEEFADQALQAMQIDPTRLGQIDLETIYDPDENLSKVRDGVKMFRLAIFGMIFVAMASLAGIFMLTIHTEHQIRWITINILSVSLLTVPAGFLALGTVQTKLSSLFVIGTPVDEAIQRFIQVILSELINTFIIYSAIAFLIGAILIVIDIFYRKRMGPL